MVEDFFLFLGWVEDFFGLIRNDQSLYDRNDDMIQTCNKMRPHPVYNISWMGNVKQRECQRSQIMEAGTFNKTSWTA